MKQKALALIVSLAMLVTICVPGTFAVEAAGQSVCEKTEHTHTDACYTKSETPSCGLELGAGAHTHDDSCYAKELTCTLEEHTHDERCYQAATTENNEETKQPEKKECTCGAVAGEDGTIIHAEDCPLYVAPVVPEKPAHIEGCVDGCTVEGCTCPCHELSLFERLMACETLWDLYTLAEATPEEELLALTEEENAKIEAKIEALEPAPLPPVGEGTADVPADEPVISEIIYPTVNFDNVAPFGAPVEG